MAKKKKEHVLFDRMEREKPKFNFKKLNACTSKNQSYTKKSS